MTEPIFCTLVWQDESSKIARCARCAYSAKLPRLDVRRNCAAAPAAPAIKRACGTCGAKPSRAPIDAPALPGAITRAKNFSAAVTRDVLAGRPRRSPELIARIFSDHCAVCPLYNAEKRACSKCGCPVTGDPTADRNKLAWAQEKCPDGRWPIQTANLIFYCLPLRHPNRVWQWHVAELRRRLHIFNGRKIVWIATKGSDTPLAMDLPDAVMAEFGDDAAAIEFVTAPNDPRYWETPAFRNMLRMVSGQWSVVSGPGEPLRLAPQTTDHSPLATGHSATWYFHAKGVRRAKQDAVRPWCEAIYHHNLDRWDEVKEILSVYPCAGIARQPVGPISQADASWHFAGTGFWFNNQALFSRPNWDSIHDHTHAVEAYLSTQFCYDSAYCLAHDNAGQGDVYAPSTWADWRAVDRPPAVAPKSETGADRPSPTDLSLFVLGHDRERLRWTSSRPGIEKIFLPDLDTRNDLAECRFFHAPREFQTEYVGLCSQSWDQKYRRACLPLADLDTLPREPRVVWAAHPAGEDWVMESENAHRGMGAVLTELAGHLGLLDYDLRRPSLFANNFVAHRDVLADLAVWHQKLLAWCLYRWGWRPPYDSDSYFSAHGGGGATRHFSFLGERFTTLYFCAARQLEIRPIPRSVSPPAAQPETPAPIERFWTNAGEKTRLSSRVVTAADDRYFAALNLFVCSLQETHDSTVTVFDVGLREDQVAWLRGRGVTIDRSFLTRASPAIDPCWLKPDMIAAAAAGDPHLLWIDADTIISGSLAPLEDHVGRRFFVAPCSAAPIFCPADPALCVENFARLYDRFPVAARLAASWPNAGVVGLDATRDRELLDTWREMCGRAIIEPTLRRLMRCWDQGALHWAIESHGLRDTPTADLRFNDCRLQPGPLSLDALRAACADKHRRDDARVIHFAGHNKPYSQNS